MTCHSVRRLSLIALFIISHRHLFRVQCFTFHVLAEAADTDDAESANEKFNDKIRSENDYNSNDGAC